jgi:hypothetical protein
MEGTRVGCRKTEREAAKISETGPPVVSATFPPKRGLWGVRRRGDRREARAGR